MSKAHQAILDSLRQPHWIQIKGIQSSEVHDDLCWNNSQPSLPCDTGTASSSATQSKLQLSRCWAAHLYSIRPLPVWGSLCQGKEGPRILIGSSHSPMKTPWALLTKLGGLCWYSITCSQPGWFEIQTDTLLQGQGLDPSLISNTDKSLQIYGPTPQHLMTLLMSVGVLGHVEFGAPSFL